MEAARSMTRQGAGSRVLRIAMTAAAAACVCAIALAVLADLFLHLFVYRENAAAIVCAAIAAIAVLLLLARARRPRLCLVLILWFSLLLRLSCALLVPTVPMSDWASLLDAARSAASGDFSWARAASGYFYLWAYQIPFALYEAALVRLGGTLAIRLANVSWMVGANALVYAAAKRAAGERAALCAAFLYAVLPDLWSMASVLTNHHAAIFFALLGVLLLCGERTFPRCALAGACLGLSQLMRSEAVVLLLAAGCAALCLPSGKGAGRALLCALCAAGGYLLVTKGTEACLRLAGIAPNGIGNHAPEWKFVLGLDFSGSGSYSDRNGYVLGIADASLRRAEALRIIRGSLAESGHPVRFFLKKILGLWSGTAGVENALQGYYPTDTLFGRITAGAFERIASVCTRAVSPILWAGAVLSVRPLFAPREKDRPLLISLFAAAGLFLIFLLIEAQARYRYAAMPFACLLACPALSRIRLPSGNRKTGAGSAP